MRTQEITIPTSGEGFYDITDTIQKEIASYNAEESCREGILVLYIPHTSCALTINESYDPTAKEDMENFLKYLAPENLKFIRHTSEGPDDSPSHMKSILLQTSLTIPIDQGKLCLGTWQGIYLCEFRKDHKKRKVLMKLMRG